MYGIHPSSRRSIGSGLLAGGALAILAAAVSPVSAVAASGTDHARTISGGGINVAVPARGMGVVASALMADGGVHQLRVDTAPDGSVSVVESSAAVSPKAAGVSPAGSPSACSDSAHNVLGSWWHTGFHWSFRSGTTPGYMSAATAESELKKAVAAITGEHNDCGRADHINATSTYDGRTTRRPQIDSNSSCTGTDNHNTVGFGDLSNGVLAYTCWWFIGSRTVEADMQLNKHDFHFAVTPSSCSQAYILRGVATHEFGHVYGLGHVSQANHANLTMSTAIYECDASDSTLGLGDMLGLEVHY